MDAYKYDLKENFGRRAIAMVIDSIVIGVILVFIGAIIVGFMNAANPMSIVFGFLADSVIPSQDATGDMTPTAGIMAVFSIFLVLVTMIYFTLFEANGRRTLGKKFMHLDLVKDRGAEVGYKEAFMRNLVKVAGGLIGGFVLGIFGWALGILTVLLVDYYIARDQKGDVRQRFSESWLDTMTTLEDDELPLGAIKLPVPKKAEKAKVTPEEQPDKGPSPLIEEEGEEKIKLLPRSIEEERKRQPEPVDDSEEPAAEKKVPFWKKLFGSKEEGFSSTKEEPAGEIPEEEERLGLPPLGKGREESEIVLTFMMEYDIREERGKALYDAGYRDMEEFRDAIVEDLMMIKGINPTIAKRIVQKAHK